MARPKVEDVVKRYENAKNMRSRHENDWRLASAYCLPRHYNAWRTDGPSFFGGGSTDAVKRIAYDSTGVRSLPKYVAVLEQIATPHRMKYHALTASNQDLMRIRRVKEYYDEVTNLLFKMRYSPTAYFIQAAAEVYASIGTYGTGPCYLGRRTPNALSRVPSFFYRSCHLKDIYILVNDQGEVDTVMRRFWLNKRQFEQKFPEQALPKSIATTTDADGDFFEFIHVVQPREDHDPTSLGVNRHPIVGSYIAVKDETYVGEEEGYRSIPYLTPRTFTESDDPYGFSPAQRALPALGTASSIKKTTLKQGQKAADPVLLAHDDGVMNGPVDLRPGAVNYGGVDSQGRRLIQSLETGNFSVSEKILQDERADIEDSFFVFIFRLLEENREMTATEVVERAAKETALLSPTMGRLQSEWIAKFVDRELDMADEMGMMPQMPPELIEAKGEYENLYTSPMAKNIYAEETSGFMRAVEMSLNIVNATQDQSHLDHFDFDVAIPEISSNMAVPARWMTDMETKKARAEERAAQQEQQQLVENAGPIAGALKAAQGSEDGANV